MCWGVKKADGGTTEAQRARGGQRKVSEVNFIPKLVRMAVCGRCDCVGRVEDL